MSPRTLWISSAAVLGALAAVGLYVRSPQSVSRKTSVSTASTREKPTALVPVADQRQRVFTVGERGERLAVAMDEVCLKGADGKATYVKPELRVRAKHMRAEGMLRHASLTALLL